MLLMEAILTSSEETSLMTTLDSVEEDGVTLVDGQPAFSVTSSKTDAAVCYQAFSQNGQWVSWVRAISGSVGSERSTGSVELVGSAGQVRMHDQPVNSFLGQSSQLGYLGQLG